MRPLQDFPCVAVVGLGKNNEGVCGTEYWDTCKENIRAAVSGETHLLMLHWSTADTAMFLCVYTYIFWWAWVYFGNVFIGVCPHELLLVYLIDVGDGSGLQAAPGP